MMLGIKLERSISHYRDIVVEIGKKTFVEDDLRLHVDEVITRMVVIFFESDHGENFKQVLLEAARDCEVKEL